MHNVINKRHIVDGHTVALYRFDEGKGGKAYDACGDTALTLRSEQALWGKAPDDLPAARFSRSNGDSNLFLGPVNNDKLQLRTCRNAWTVEAWIRYTGPQGNDRGKTYAAICSNDDEGLSLPRGPRGEWLFALHTAIDTEGLTPWGRFTGKPGRARSNVMTGSGITPVIEDYKGENSLSINDRKWHHAAWQFRFCGQQHSLFIDGNLVWLLCQPSGRILINDFLETHTGKINTSSLPLAFTGKPYRQEPCTGDFTLPLQWSIIKGFLPEGISLNAKSGLIEGVPEKAIFAAFTVKVVDSSVYEAEQNLSLKVASDIIEKIEPDKHTVVTYDWQGDDGKFIPDLMGDKELELTWANMMGDIRIPGRLERKYPFMPGGGEWGFVGPQHNDKLDPRTCHREWTVEAWIRPGGNINHYGQPFDFGHICGTYDNTMKGVRELYLAYDGSGDKSMAPGIIVNSDNNKLLNLNPWRQREGIVVEKDQLGIHDTEWRHVAWQYNYETNIHELFLDATLIWQMNLPDDQRIVNRHTHDAQFSIGSRLNGYARYGGSFNWLGWGNFFGQIGEIRISNIRRYNSDDKRIF